MHLSSYCNIKSSHFNLDTKRQSHFIFVTDETRRFATNMNCVHNALIKSDKKITYYHQGGIFRLTCSYRELTEDHVLTSAYVKIFRIITRNAVNKSFWRKKDCSWPPLNKYAMNIWLSSLRIRAHLEKLENRKTSPCSPCSPCAPNLLHDDDNVHRRRWTANWVVAPKPSTTPRTFPGWQKNNHKNISKE